MKKTRLKDYLGLFGMFVLMLSVILVFDLQKPVLFVLIVGVIIGSISIEIKYRENAESKTKDV